MPTARRVHYSYDEYLRALELSEVKLEYCDGVIYAMVGGTPAHAALASAVNRLLGNALLGSCTTYSSDLRVRIEAAGLTAFPDVTVICGALQPAPLDKHAATNPTILVEVTSRSTEDYDRGDKLSCYKQLASLKAVLFVSHRLKQVTVIERSGATWSEREVRGGENVSLLDPKLTLSVDELYAGVQLEP
ncbi:MAG: Uma2 family endonuclease [Myxococcaceae bacterium]|nr:Uma2 family endonuclease [Myxococcaceae bacterium]